MSPGAVADWATIGASVVAVGGLCVAAWQARKAAKNTRGTMWLELRRMFDAHSDVHRKLRPGGLWAPARPGVEGSLAAGPASVEDWASVESYMGLLEHCEIMIEQRLIDWATFNRLYAYRVINVAANPIIRQGKLINEAASWRDFLKLLDRATNGRTVAKPKMTRGLD